MTQKKIFTFLVVFFISQSQSYAHTDLNQHDQNGHVIHHYSLVMTPEQKIFYKKSAAATLDFLDQFRTGDQRYKDFLPKIKNELVFSYNHPYRTREFCNAFALCRDDYVGIKISNMTKLQKDKFYELMQTLLAPYGYQKMKKVFERQPIIFDIEQAYRDNPKKFPVIGGVKGTSLANWVPVDSKGHPNPRDQGDYYIAFFGDLEQFINGNLSPNMGFGIRVEGHHLSLNFTFKNKDGHLIVSSSPTFYGSNPIVVPPAPISSPNKYKNWKLKVGDAFMLSETQIAKLFIKSLTRKEQNKSLYPHMASPMFESAAAIKPTETQDFKIFSDGKISGIKISNLQGSKEEIAHTKYLLLELLKLIVATQKEVSLSLNDIEKDLDNMKVAFYGKLEKFDEFYLRLQSQKFLLELVQSNNFSVVNPGNVHDKHDPKNNGLYNNNHVHIMFRDLRNDWGYNPLYFHEKQNHHKR